MSMKTEVKDIKNHLIEISRKIDDLIYEREIAATMKLSEDSLSDFFEDEPDLYEMRDLKVRYR
ncbi:MAG: hypothetical protein U9N35_07075 [Euryarchaeota archaeon]|nr:hypothetical protein [Euryarchaeota archaeon]